MFKRIPYLAVLSSASQLYSGTGKAMFEWMRFAKPLFEFAILIDNANPLNYQIARDFCIAENIQFLPCGPSPHHGCADPGADMAPSLVGSGRWPIIEIISWANTKVNLDVLDALPPDTALLFTPHTQPAWTMPGFERFSMLEAGFDRLLAECDIICCVSPQEQKELLKRVPAAKVRYCPNSVDAALFHPGAGLRQNQLLVVADFNEARKRTDLSLGAIRRLAKRNPGYRGMLVGKNSESVTLPWGSNDLVERLGYVSAQRLRELYRQSAAYLLLTDFEAFGIPIAEALCSGTPVVCTRTPEIESLFDQLPGCYLVDNKDDAEVDAAVDQALFSAMQPQMIADAASARFGHTPALSLKLDAIESLGFQAPFARLRSAA